MIEATVRKADEKERIVRELVCRSRFGFRPAIVGRLLVLPDTDTARRRVRGSATVLDVAFPSRGADVRRWLRQPSGGMSGLLFVADTNRRSGTGQTRRAATSQVSSPTFGLSPI